MPREPIPTWHFVVSVVRKGDRFLLVHERKHGQCWYLPAGRVEPGETFAQAAHREAVEETGVPIRLTGVLRFEHTPTPRSARVRVVFLAEPADETPPKTKPDGESLGAAWVALADLGSYKLRGPDVAWLMHYVIAGGPVAPLSLLGQEGEGEGA